MTTPAVATRKPATEEELREASTNPCKEIFRYWELRDGKGELREAIRERKPTRRIGVSSLRKSEDSTKFPIRRL